MAPGLMHSARKTLERGGCLSGRGFQYPGKISGAPNEEIQSQVLEYRCTVSRIVSKGLLKGYLCELTLTVNSFRIF